MFPRQGFKTATIYKIIQDLNKWLEDQNPNQSNYFNDQFRKVSETKIPKAKCMNFRRLLELAFNKLKRNSSKIYCKLIKN